MSSDDLSAIYSATSSRPKQNAALKKRIAKKQEGKDFSFYSPLVRYVRDRTPTLDGH